MKKLLYILWFIPMTVWTQTSTEKYIKNTAYKVETTDGNTHATNGDTIVYDGLGRAVQNIAKQAGGQRQDIIVPVFYDEFGR